MKSMHRYMAVAWLLSLVQLACAGLTPGAAPPTEATAGAAPTAQPSAAPDIEPSAVPTREPAAPTPTDLPRPTVAPTAAALELEILQWQAWDDRLGDTRVIVLVRNPYDFPVALGSQAAARNSAGEVIRTAGLLFQDGISGGAGFIPPGGTAAANGCFTCLEAHLSEPWETIDFYFSPEEATGLWNYTTEVAASDAAAAFEPDSPIFDVRATVTNNSGETLQRISVQFMVFDQAGTFVGTGEASAWDVPPGAVVGVDSYGIGHTPEGPVTVEVSVLGVNY